MSDKYEHEIDDLLHRLEGRMRSEPLSRRFSRRFRPYSRGLRNGFAAFLRRPPTEQFMIAGLGLTLLAFTMGAFEPLKMWSFYVSVLSIVFFVLGIALSLAHRQSPGYQKRWRGRDLEYGPHGPTVWTYLRNLLRRRRR